MVAAVGALARQHLLHYCPFYSVSELLYCLSDISDYSENSFLLPPASDNKIIFAMVGTVEERKGQDILINAIERLDDDILAKCFFIFVGRSDSDAIMAQIRNKIKTQPDHFSYIPQIDRDCMPDFFRQVDCEICASRDDPMPVVVTEALRAQKLVICSDHTGSAALLRKHHAGLIYDNNSDTELAYQITKVVQNPSQELDITRANGRKVYEQYFTEQAFMENIKPFLNQKRLDRFSDSSEVLQERLFRLEKAMSLLTSEKQKYETEVDRLYQENSFLQSSLNNCKNELEAIRACYFAVENAFLWKITKPIRIILDWVKKCLRNHNLLV